MLAGGQRCQYVFVAQLGSAKRTNERKDLQRKYVYSGKDTILQHEEPSSSAAPAQGFTSIAQIAHGSAHPTIAPQADAVPSPEPLAPYQGICPVKLITILAALPCTSLLAELLVSSQLHPCLCRQAWSCPEERAATSMDGPQSNRPAHASMPAAQSSRSSASAAAGAGSVREPLGDHLPHCR